MDFWRWLTSPDGLPVLVALIALIGTVVAVAATIITQVLATNSARKSEQTRLEWEKARYTAELQAAETSRFEDIKRIAFVKHVQTRDLYHRTCVALYRDEPEQARKKVLIERVRQYGRELRMGEREIQLLAPDVTEAIEAIERRRDIEPIQFIDTSDEPALSNWFLQYTLATDEISKAMRQGLAIER